MAHLLKSGTSLLAAGNNVFRVRDKFSYSVSNTNSNDNNNNNGVIFDPIKANNRLFVLNDTSGTISVVDATTFNITNTVAGITGSPFCIAVEPSGSYLLVGCLGGNVYKIDSTTLTLTTVITGLTNATGIAFDPVISNNRFLISQYSNNTVKVFDSTTYSLTNTLTGFNSPFGIAFDPVIANNRVLICNNGDGTISLVDATSLITISNYSTGGGTTFLAFDPVVANNRFIVVLDGSSFKIFNSTTYGLLDTVDSIADHAQCICFDSTNNNRFVISNRSGGTPSLSIITQVAT